MVTVVLAAFAVAIFFTAAPVALTVLAAFVLAVPLAVFVAAATSGAVMVFSEFGVGVVLQAHTPSLIAQLLPLSALP